MIQTDNTTLAVAQALITLRDENKALKNDLAQKKAALLVIAQWCDRGLKDGMRKNDMNEVFLWIRKLAKEEMEKDYKRGGR